MDRKLFLMLKLFDFICDDCGKTFEILLECPTHSDISCPHCKSLHTHRTWTKSQFRIHGQGAYNNKMVL